MQYLNLWANNGEEMKVWIDITNTPHVRFFKKIIEHLEKNGEEVIITTRKLHGIHELLKEFGFEFISIGKHKATLKDKLIESTYRAYRLSKLISKLKPDVAVSKHSIELPRVAFGLKIPIVYVLDNEHAIEANKLTLPLCETIILPKVINVWDIIKCGADPNSLVRYNGTSEILHFEDHEYDENILEKLGIERNKDHIILMRPEPIKASYFKASHDTSILIPVIEKLRDYADILVLPRSEKQKKMFEKQGVVVLKPPIDTFSLIKKCDLMIGAGGTMNREAALLGTPVISCYPGKILAVDKFYIEKGLMYHSLDPKKIVELALKLLGDKPKKIKLETDNLFKIIINKIYEACEN